jgi:NAD(P)-dependent dehydrogenase (short-subunit alcohol dehydrogenase family)
MKNIVVIGGSKGIGASLVQILAQSADHHIWSLSRSQNVHSAANVTEIPIDILSEPFPTDQLPETIDGLAYLPGTINLKPFRGLKTADFEEDFRINVLGAVNTIQALEKQLKKSGDSSVVLFSTVAVQQGMPFHSSIAAAKGAIEGLTRSLAAEFAPKVRVNCIAPSLTDTSLAERLLSSEARREAGAARHPLKTIGQPEDIANLASFLLSDQSRWISGQVLGVDGGMSRLRV